jgi:hypothetical protein
MEYTPTLINDLFKILSDDGKHTALVDRIKDLIGKSKKEQVDGMESIIADCKNKTLTYDTPTMQMLKHIYRKMTS